MEGRGVTLEVSCQDAFLAEADVLALKYARDFYGVDRAAVERLSPATRLKISPPIDDYQIIASEGGIRAHLLLFLGVPDLYQFNYEEIRAFGAKVISVLAQEVPGVETLAMTLHGPGYGLDEQECFLSEVGGIAEAIASGEYPEKLETIKIIERSPGRAQRLNRILQSYLPDGQIYADARALNRRIGEERSETLRSAGRDSAQKPHVFVAMPFADDTADLFHYGIRRAVNSSGYLCERIDLIPAVGDVVTQIRNRIETAKFVVAELTGVNPNVYLEVGYAWGRRIPTILLIKKDAISTLRFDVSSQRCIVYSSIRDLEEKLASELSGLSGLASIR